MIEKDPNQEENLVKRKASLIARVRRPLSAILILGMLATGCSNLTGDEPNDDPTNNSQTDPGNGKENGGQNDKYKDYSDLFRYVKTTYANDISQLEATLDQIDDIVDFKNELKKTKYKCFPWTFLTNQGYDISKIKNDEQYAQCSSFIKKNEPNNLYMTIKVLHNDATPYYDVYLIRYKLTDQEAREYPYYFPENTNTYEGCFINDAISATKDVEILANSKIVKTADDAMCEYISLKDPYNTSFNDVILKNYDLDNNTFVIYACPFGNSRNSSFVEIPMTAGWWTELDIRNGIYYAPDYHSNKYGFEIGENYKDSTVETVDSFKNIILQSSISHVEDRFTVIER